MRISAFACAFRGILKTFAGIFGSEYSRTLYVALLEDEGGSDGGCADCRRGAWRADGGFGFDAAGPSGAAVRAGFRVAGGRGRGATRCERNAAADCPGAGTGHET